MASQTTESSFDELASGLASGTLSRGKALKLMGAALLGGTLASLGIGEAGADPLGCKRNGKNCKRNTQCCSGNCVDGVCGSCPMGTTLCGTVCCPGDLTGECTCATLVDGSQACADSAAVPARSCDDCGTTFPEYTLCLASEPQPFCLRPCPLLTTYLSRSNTLGSWLKSP